MQKKYGMSLHYIVYSPLEGLQMFTFPDSLARFISVSETRIPFHGSAPTGTVKASNALRDDCMLLDCVVLHEPVLLECA